MDSVKWDSMWSEYWNPGGNRMTAVAAQNILEFVPPGGRVLDVATGDGRFARMIAGRQPGGSVHGIDYASRTIDALKRDQTLPLNMSVEVGNAFNLSKFENCFDVVLNSSMIQYCPDASEREKLVSQMVLACKPGGHAIVGSTNRKNVPHELLKAVQGSQYRCFPESSLTREELRLLFDSVAGLSVVREFGVVPEWGIERLDFVHRVFPHIGKIIRPFRKALDRLSKGRVSDHFGFHIYVVARCDF